jgi:hypothetical protein
MSSYGRNFEFRVPPENENRSGRFFLNGGVDIPIGAPVKVDSPATENDLGQLPVVLATGATATPRPGQAGIAVYEHIQYQGNDPYLTTYSDKDTVPAGKALQVVSGQEVKVCFRNTSATTFLHTRAYTGRVMVAGIGIATPTIAVGDLLTPGVGDGTSGYWAETGTAGNAWLVVTKVDNARAEVEARPVF